MNHVYLLSDATGETVERVARAALTQFKDVDVRLHRFGQMRTCEDIIRALDEVRHDEPGIIFYTLVNPELAQGVIEKAGELQIEAVDLITPLLFKLAEFLAM